jgi:cell division GTPase FtsZ
MSEDNTQDAMKKALNTVKGVEATPSAAPSPSAPRPISAPKPPATKQGGQVGNLAAGLSPKSRKRAEKDVVVNDTFDYDVAMRMAFIGAGQGGGRMANGFYELGYRRVCAFNTTDMDFAELNPGIKKHSLDVGGAAKDTELARQALAGREEEVRDLLQRSWGNEIDCALVCVSLGGGTGSGTVGSLVRVVRQYMLDKTGQARVGALVSLPTLTEGYQVNRNAVVGFRELLELGVSPLLIIDNAKVHQLYKPSMSRLHATANETISQLFHLFNQLAATRSEITFDRSEFAQLLDAGIVVMGAADIQNTETPADISSAIRDDLTNNVLAEIDLRTGKKGACLFVAGQEVLDELDSDFFDAGFSQLDRTLGAADNDSETVVHRGLYVGAERGLQCYTMIAELDLPKERLKQMADKGGLTSGNSGSTVADWLGVSD